MADQNRTVQLDVAVSTSGAEGIRKLAVDVEDLAKSGGDAAPQFVRLAAELNKIAAQADAVQALSKLSDEVRLLGVAETEAREKSGLLAAELEKLSAASKLAAEAEAAAQAAVRGAKTDLDQKRESLARLRIETDAADRDTLEYTEGVKALRLAILDAKNVERDAAEARRVAGEATKAAEAAESQLQATYRASARDVQAANTALEARKGVLDKDRQALEADGVATENLAAAQTTLLQAYTRVSEQVQQTVAEQARLAALGREEIAANIQIAASLRERERAGQEALAAERAAFAEAEALARRLADAQSLIASRAKAAGEALQQAFAQTGVRSIAAINEEINQIGASLVRLKNNTTVSGAEFDRAFTAAQTRIKALKTEIDGVSPAIAKASTSTNVFGEALRNLTAIYGGFQLATSFLDANIQMENLRRTLVLVTGSTESAAQQIAFLKQTANDSGVAVGSIAQAYSKFVASAGSAGIQLEVVNRAFAAVTKSSGALGLSSEDTASALSALGQIASKGKVSLEELQQQLGDRLPAVLATTAKGLGVTTAQLTKLIETGHLLADNTFFNAFSDGIEKTFLKSGAAVEGLQAQIGRFKNALNEAFTKIGESGVVDALTDALKGLAPVVSGAANGLVGLGKAMGTTVAATTDLIGSLLRLDFTSAGRGVKQFRLEIDELNKSYFKSNPTEVNAALLRYGTAAEIAAERARLLGNEQNKVAAAQDKTTASTKTAAQAQAALASSVDQATEAVIKGTANAAQIAIVYDTLIAKSKSRIKALEEEVQAAKSNGEASVRLAEIGGNEVTIRNAQIAAAEGNARALTALASERRTEAVLSLAEVNALEREAEAHGTLTESRKKELDAMRLKVDALSAEAKKSEEAAALADTEAAKRRVLAETYGDQSDQLDKLKDAYLRAADAAAKARIEEERGVGTHEDTVRAVTEAAVAEAKYHDALDDTVKSLERKVTALKSGADIQTATFNVQKALLQQEIDLAKLNGDSYTVLIKTIEQKQLDIKIIQAKVAAQRAEAAATIAVAEATKAELEAEGKLTPEKRASIDASIAAAKVKQLEADATELSIKAMQKEVENLQMYGTAAGTATTSTRALTGAVYDSAKGFDASAASSGLAKIALGEYITQTEAAAVAQLHLAGSFNSLATAARNAQDFSVLGKNTDKDGFSTGADGQRIGSNTQANIPEGGSFDKAAFDREVLRSAQSGNPWEVDPQRFVRPGAGSALNTTTPQYRNPDFADAMAREQARQATLGGFAPAPTKTPGSATPSGVTTNIHIDGKVTTLGLNSQNDVNSLAGVLSTLAGAKARTA